MNQQYQMKIKTSSGHIVVTSDTQHMSESICKGCKKKIYWAKTKFGKSIPISKLSNDEFVTHFSDCPTANYFRKKKILDNKKYAKTKRANSNQLFKS